MSDKLKPCPFCGGKAIFSKSITVADEILELSFVYCESCRAETSLHRIEEDAIRAWNKRAQPTFSPDEIDAIRRMIDGRYPRGRTLPDIEQSIINKCAAALKGGKE